MSTEASEFAKEAQALWEAGDHEGSIQIFTKGCNEVTDPAGREMLLVGKGHSLSQMERYVEAVTCFKTALETAGSEAQQSFITNMIRMAESNIKATVEDVKTAAGLHTAICGGVTGDGNFLNEGIIVYPPCEEVSCSASPDGIMMSDFSDVEQAVIKHVSLHGAKEWDVLSDKLSISSDELHARWIEIAPAVQQHLSSNPEMPCGHTCGTCPTRDTCQLHGELDELVDLEDMITS